MPKRCVIKVLTALGNSSGGGEVSVLTVHVVGATTGVITQPDAKVFHLQGRFLMNLWIEGEGGREKKKVRLDRVLLKPQHNDVMQADH